VGFVEGGRFHVREHAADQRFISKKFRRNCGVRLQSKRTMVSLRCIRGNKLSQTGTERRRTSQDLLREPSEVRRRRRQIGEQVPDLRIFLPLTLHRLNEIEVRARLRVPFDPREKHRIHAQECFDLTQQVKAVARRLLRSFSPAPVVQAL
jgi:hypothetical protein